MAISAAELLKADGRAAGRFDSRYSGIVYDRDGDIGDASFVATRGAVHRDDQRLSAEELKFESDLPYNVLTDVQPWHFDADNRYLDVVENTRTGHERKSATKGMGDGGLLRLGYLLLLNAIHP